MGNLPRTRHMRCIEVHLPILGEGIDCCLVVDVDGIVECETNKEQFMVTTPGKA